MKYEPAVSTKFPKSSFLDGKRGDPFLSYGIPRSKNAKDITIPYAIRDRHVFIGGMTRHGKSTFMEHMILQDIENRQGVCVIDPKGDLVKHLLELIPEHRKDDCIYLNLNTPVPIDFMTFSDDGEREELVGSLKYILHKAGFAPRMEGILYDVIYTLLEANDRLPEDRKTNFIDIYEFFKNPKRHQEIMDALAPDSPLRREWKKMPNDEALAPILNRMKPFVRTKSLRAVFGSNKPGLRLEEVMNDQKILLVDLGGMGESRQIFGSLLIAKIQQTAFRRHNIPQRERIPFFLYVDEFQNFQTDENAFDRIFSMAGGYGLRITVANQFVNQLSSEIKSAVLGNVSTYILFKLGGESARVFADVITPCEPRCVTALPPYQALFKVAGQETFVTSTPKPLMAPAAHYAEYIQKRTVDEYACNSTREPQDKRDVQHDQTPKADFEPLDEFRPVPPHTS